MSTELNFMVGGEAGQGVQLAGFLLAKCFARGDYQVFADQDYESRIRGGHNFFRVRVANTRIGAIAEELDVLIALNEETIRLHGDEVAEEGAIIYDAEKYTPTPGKGSLFHIPLSRLAGETAGSDISINVVAVGAALALVECEPEMLDTVLRQRFVSGDLAETNIAAARAGYNYARSNLKEALGCNLQLSGVRRMLLTGNEAIALGAVAAGCRFIAAYPMTPATSIMEYLAENAEAMGMVVVQPEDEIAAVNMAIGASFAGVRAMTATSGSGFCLMVEGLGLAGMTETPVVIVDAQRPGPAVGLPTRTEQGDLEFVIHAHHGDFPRAVLAPATIEDAFWMTARAFNLAEKYQIPVIILTDHHLASSYATVDEFDLGKIVIDHGQLYSGNGNGDTDYHRHRVTQSGITPRAFPGGDGYCVVTDSDEHDEDGHPVESAAIRIEQVQKRMRKAFSLHQEIAVPEIYGQKRAETVLIGWGSSYGALRETVDILHKKGVSINLLHLREMWPFPAEAVVSAIDRTKHSFVVESNASGQLARLIRAETGREVTGRVLRYDGRPLTPGYIVNRLEKECL